MINYFRFPIAFAAIVFAALYFYTRDISYVGTAIDLAFVEVSLSFDNAVVNAIKLKEMSGFWRTAFLTVGLLIAVGFMRFFLPLEIVSFFGKLSLHDAYSLAFTNHEKFTSILEKSNDAISGFGGAFLAMVAFKYFIDSEKESHWISIFEIPMTYIHKFAQICELESIHAILVLAVSTALYFSGWSLHFLLAAICGVIAFMVIEIFKTLIELFDSTLEKKENVSGVLKLITGGLGLFIYLEVLDASFSFDGVIAAFAISKNVLVVASGLGVGAAFVRGMTLMLVDTGKMAEYKYLENGAFFAILAIAAFMFTTPMVHIPDTVVAVTSMVVIITAWLHSYVANKLEVNS